MNDLLPPTTPDVFASLDRHCLDELKRRIGLLDYLQNYLQWEPRQRTAGGQLVGLCPLHSETQPSFLIHPRKNLFYCHGCGQGGDLIRLVELFHGMTFSQALQHLRSQVNGTGLFEDTVAYYHAHLLRSPEALAYLTLRGLQHLATIRALRIGYAPGACLRAHLQSLGYPHDQIRQSGLITPQGRDTLYRRIVFPFGDNLYGRSLDSTAPHRFLRLSKGGLYRWHRLHRAPEILLVEGFFDLAALFQAGFSNVTSGGGARLNRTQFQQLITGSRTVWIVFDSDDAGQRAAAQLSLHLQQAGQMVRRVLLPYPHDPASYFASGADATQFQALMRVALP
jgi:DNA primase